MEAMLSKKPETYTQLIGRSLKLYCASFVKVIFPAILLSIIIFTPRLLSNWFDQDMMNISALSDLSNLWFIVIDLVALVLFIAIIWHMHCVIRNQHEPFIEDIYIGLRKVLFVFVAVFIQSLVFLGYTALTFGFLYFLSTNNLIFSNSMMGMLATGILFALLVGILLYLSMLFVFFVPLIAIENKGIFRALKTSVLLVWNHWLRVFTTQLTPWFCYALLLYAIKYLLGINIRIYFTPYTGYDFLPSILHLILFAFFIPWVAALLLVQLKDLEIRNHLLPRKTRGK